MPKMKTNRSAAKRVKKTGSGKMKRFSPYHRHILTKKTRKQKRNLRKSSLISDQDLRHFRVLLPN